MRGRLPLHGVAIFARAGGKRGARGRITNALSRWLLTIALLFARMIGVASAPNVLEVVNTSVSKHRHYDVFESTYKSRPMFHFRKHELPSSRIDYFRYNVFFNKPLYINATVPLRSSAAQPYLDGLARLECGNTTFESFSLKSSNGNSPAARFWPIFDQTANGHMFTSILMMSRNLWQQSKRLQFVKPKDCVLHFLDRLERGINNFNVLVSADGEPVKGTVEFKQHPHKIQENHCNGNDRLRQIKYTIDKSYFHSDVSSNMTAERKHKEAFMGLSPIKFMKLAHIYTQFVDVLLNDTTFVELIYGNRQNGSLNTTTKRRRNLLNEHNEAGEQRALMRAVETLRMKTFLKLGLHAGELYEVILKPIATAMGKQLPEIIMELVKFPLTVLLRDLTTEGMKEPMTEPLLNQLDPRSLFGAGSESTPTASTGGHKAIKHAAGVADDVGLLVTDNVVKALSKAVWHRLELRMPKPIASQCARMVGQGVISTVTYTLTHSISRALVEILSKSLTKAIAKNVNSALIPSLTYSLVPVITHSLMHSPRADYYCYYCTQMNVYCELCRQQHAADYKQDYYISYYTGYYTEYYAHAYSSGLSDGSAEEYFSGASPGS